MKKNVIVTAVILLLCVSFTHAQIKPEEILQYLKHSTLLYCKVDTTKRGFLVKNMEFTSSNGTRIYLESNAHKCTTNLRCVYVEIESNGEIFKTKFFLKELNKIINETPLKEFKE